MKLTERQKMCTSCEGRIAIDALVCPYCAADQGSASQHQSIQQSLSSLYPPPYAAKNTGPKSVHSKPQEPMPEKRFQQTTSSGIPNIHLDQSTEQQAEDKSSFWPLLLLSIGANLLVIGLLQLFFSNEGLLTLEWDSSYWFVYCLGALPLCYFGYKKAKGL